MGHGSPEDARGRGGRNPAGGSGSAQLRGCGAGRCRAPPPGGSSAPRAAASLPPPHCPPPHRGLSPSVCPSIRPCPAPLHRLVSLSFLLITMVAIIIINNIDNSNNNKYNVMYYYFCYCYVFIICIEYIYYICI